MRVLWVVLLSILLFVVGFFGGTTVGTFTGIWGAMNQVCNMAKVAETDGLVSKAERDELVKKLAGAKDNAEAADFDTICAAMGTKP